ncbi:MAG TPA: hypothetical protein EYQ74_08490 [Planctomycetes bacterium]|nr:hypothetical protein [Planctomycetota bacterium]HIK60109.1 hypothetical protein [Planctomycetota bacterium]
MTANAPVSIDAPDSEPPPSSVSLSFSHRWGESAPSPSGEDPAPARKFWEPQPSAAVAEPDPASVELVIEMSASDPEAADAPVGEVSTPEEQVSEEEWLGGSAKPEGRPEPAPEPSDDGGPKRPLPPEPHMPEAATYGTPWPQDSGPELSRPLHVRFPTEPPTPEAVQAEDASTDQGSDRPLNWDFDLTGPSVRFSDNVSGESTAGYSAPGDSAVDPGNDGVGGPFA